jgi:E3 ubiquitin-protein ligase BRE1
VDKQARLLLSLSELQREKSRLYDDKLRYKTMETLVKAESASLKQTIAALQRERDALQDSVRVLEQHRQGVEEVVRKYEALKQSMEKRLQHMAASVRETRLAALRVKEEKDGLLRAYGQRGKLLDERELRIATLEGQYSNAKDKYSELHARLKQLQEREREREKERGEGAGLAGAGGGDGEGSRAVMSDDRVELQQLKSRLKCSVCCVNPKTVVISKCWHLFCADCVDANLKSRHRKCPACGEKFDKQDVHNVYGLDG